MLFKTIIFYSYYERLNETKNQTNLAFFIKHGLSNYNLGNVKIVFIINNKCEIDCFNSIKYNYDIIYNDKQNYTDFEAWYDGFKYITKKYNNFLFNITEYICCLNCSVTGPFYDSVNWLNPFYEKMNKENSNICSPIINFLKDYDRGGPGPRIPSYFFIIKISPKIMNLLLNCKLNTNSDNTKNIGFNYNTTIFGSKINRECWILNGEYGLTRILLKNNINISCLIYSNIDYKLYDGNNELCKKYSHNLDRNINNIYKFNIEQLIFVKNNWRCSNSIRDSLPYLCEECYKYIYNKLNMKKIIYNNLNYNHLQISQIGKNNTNNQYNWYNKKQFYDLYGIYEEFNIYPIINNNINNKCIIYFHYDKSNTIKKYVIESLKTFIQLKYKIYFCTTCNYIKTNIPIKIYYFQKKNSYHYTFIDFLKLYKQDILKYDYITICNDSLILPINGIENMKKCVEKYRVGYDFWGIFESNKINIHLMSNWIEYNNMSFKELIKFYENFNTYNNFIHTKNFSIQNIETKQTEYLIKKGFKYNKILEYKDTDFINNKLNDIFGIEYIDIIKNKNILNLPYLNYLTFYL